MAPLQSSAAEMLAQPAGFGLVSGPGSGTSDSIPAALSDGEVVIPADDVRAFGAAQIMSMIKKGGKDLPKPKVQSGRMHAATGGLIEDPGAVTRVGNSYSGGNVSGPIAINGAQPGGTFSSIGGGPVSAAAQLAQPVAPKPAEEGKTEPAKPEPAKPEPAKPDNAKAETPPLRADPVPPVTPAPKASESESRPVPPSSRSLPAPL